MKDGARPIVIGLPGPPIGKGRPRFGQGRTYTDPKTKAYETELRYAAKVAMRGRQALTGPVQVQVLATMPIPSSWSLKQRDRANRSEILPTGKPDLDNILKCLDAFNEIVWADDAQVVHVEMTKTYGLEPSLIVKVAPMSPVVEFPSGETLIADLPNLIEERA